MYSIGERLQQARTQGGISLREAAQQTKIRMDYLAFFEEDYFEIPLPEIYRRGFLTLYADFLKLDTADILSEYDRRFKRRHHSYDQTETYAYAQSPEPEMQVSPEENKEETLSVGTPEESIYAKPHKDPNPSALFRFRKPIAIGAGVLVLILGLVSYLWMGGKRAAQSGPGGASAAFADSEPDESARLEEPAEEEVTLMADGGEVHVKLGQTQDRTLLAERMLTDGEQFSVKAKGEVVVRFSEGKYLKIRKGKQQYQTGVEGIGTCKIP